MQKVGSPFSQIALRHFGRHSRQWAARAAWLALIILSVGAAAAWAADQPSTATLEKPAAKSAAPAGAKSSSKSADAATTQPGAQASSQPSTSSLSSKAPQASKASGLSAQEYLNRLEEKNKNVRSMSGSFVQTKKSELFLEEHTYQGRFFYLKPNRFRIDYTGKDGKKDESTLLILAEEMWDYVPSIKQAVRMNLRSRTGRQREINQILLGFGVNAKKALEYFDVSLGQADDSGKSFTLIFTAKNPDDTMQFTKAAITFDASAMSPRTILLDEPAGDKTHIILGDVELNAAVQESLFKPKWPKDTEIVEQ